MCAVLIHVDGYHPNSYPFFGSPIITAYTVPVFGDASAIESVFTIASRLHGHQGFVPHPAAAIFVPPAYPLIAGSPLPTPSYAVPLVYQSPSYSYNAHPLTPSAEYKPPLPNNEGDVVSAGTIDGDSSTQLMNNLSNADESSSGSSLPEGTLTGDSILEVENSAEQPNPGLGEEGSELPESSLGGESVDVVSSDSEKIKPVAGESTDDSSATEKPVEGVSCKGTEGLSENCQSSVSVIVSGMDSGPQATTTLDNQGGYTLNITYGLENDHYPNAIPSAYETSTNDNGKSPAASSSPRSGSRNSTDIEVMSDDGPEGPPSGSVPPTSSDKDADRVGSSTVSLEAGFVPIPDPTIADASSFPPLSQGQFSTGYIPPRVFLDSYGLPVTENYYVLGPASVRTPLGNIPTRYPQAPGNNVYYRLQRSLQHSR